MATEREVQELLQKLRENRPRDFINSFDNNNVGMMGVLLYLYEHDQQATPGEISAAKSVSTARMAVMLKNLEEKELIIRTAHPDDTRKVLIQLSPKGYAFIHEKQKGIMEMMTRLVEHIGYERMQEYVNVSGEIKSFCTKEMETMLPAVANAFSEHQGSDGKCTSDERGKLK